VYRETVGAVFAYLSYSVGSQVAEDLTAATFERVVRSWHRYDPALGTPRQWTLAIARNVLLDHHRRQRFRRGPSLEEVPGIVDSLLAADDPAGDLLRRETVREALAQLSAQEREVIGLRYGADLPAAAVAATLGLTNSQVYDKVASALERLRKALEPSHFMDTV
jgi:RNA polymerase sigma-70 factor (ECF subfamily)